MCDYDYDYEDDVDLGLEWYLPSPEENLKDAKRLAFQEGYDYQKENFEKHAKDYASRFEDSVYEEGNPDIIDIVLEQCRLGHAQAAAEHQELDSDHNSNRLDGDQYTDLLDEKQLKQLY